MDLIDKYYSIEENWQKITDLLSELLDVDLAMINSIEDTEKNKELLEVLYKNKNTNANPFSTNLKYKLAGLFCENVYKNNEMLEVNNALNEEDWKDNPALDYGIISYLGYPINDSSNNVIGTICLEDTKERRFTETEKDLLKQFKEVIENNLQQMELTERLNENMDKGRKLHGQFLPKKLPDISELSFGTFYKPAEELGGDFYDFIKYEDQLLFYLSDVSGHDLSSSMLNIFLKETIHSYLILKQGRSENIEPEKILNYIKDRFKTEDFSTEYFINLVIGIIDLNDFNLKISNAGFQYYPVILNNTGNIFSLNTKNFPISVLNNLEKFNSVETKLNSNDLLFLCTDGLLEQSCKNNKSYDLENLFKVLIRNTESNPEYLIDRILDDFNDCIGNNPIEDDITILAIKKNTSR